MSESITQLQKKIIQEDRVLELVERRLGQRISRQQLARLSKSPDSGFPRSQRIGKKSPAFFSEDAVERYIANKLRALGVEVPGEAEEKETWFDGEPPCDPLLPPLDYVGDAQDE